MTDAGEALDRPTILIVGRGERMQAALEQALVRHDIEVESVAKDAIGEAAFAAAPDLLLLIGDAATDGGEEALGTLEQQVGTSTVPVALLTNEGLPEPVGEFRHGIVAVIRRSASADGMAREIASLARDVPQRSGEVGGELGEAQIDEIVALFSQQLRTGILSVSAEGGAAPSTQVVLRAGRPAADAIAELVERIRPLLQQAGGPLRYEFHESPAERLDLLDVSPDERAGDPHTLAGCRVLLIEQNPARADVLVQELRTAGALVVVADGAGRGLDRARTHDPDVVIIDGSGVESWATDALRMLRRDPRLRWASLLVVDAAELWPSGDDRPSLDKLSRSVHSILRPDRDMASRAASSERFETRLELIGPVRMLRALLGTGLGLKLTVRHARARVEIDLAEGLVVGAQAFAPRSSEEIGSGPAAVAGLLALGSGRVRVERRDAPSTANLMSPLDDALAAASREPSPVTPSMPPPTPAHGLSRPTSTPPSGSQDAEKLLARLEDLLVRLGDVLPAAETASPKRGRVPRPGGVLPAVKPAPSTRRPPAKQASTAPPPKRVGLAQTRRAPLSRPPPAEAAPAPSVRPPWQRSSAPPAPDDDIPVIEATAEPGELARGEHPSAAPPRTEPPAAPEEASPPTFEAYLVPATPPPPALEPVKATLAMQAVPIPPPAATPAPAPAIPVEEPLELPRSRLPLVLGVTAVLTLLVGAAAAAALWIALADPEPEPTATLPGTAGGPTATQTVSPPPPPVAVPDPTPPPPPVAVPDPAPAPAPAPEADADADADADAEAEAEADADADAEAEAEADADTEDPETDLEPDPELQNASLSAAARRDAEIAHELRSGNYDRNRGRLREAEVHYLRVLRLSPRNVRALAGLARLALARRDGTQAVRWASRLTAVAGRNPNNQVLLGDAYRAAGQRENANRAYRTALEQQPGHPNATRRLGGR